MDHVVNVLVDTGLSKREYFAALAMQGLISNAPEGNLHNYAHGAPLAVAWADALIEELNKPQP